MTHMPRRKMPLKVYLMGQSLSEDRAVDKEPNNNNDNNNNEELKIFHYQ